MNRIEFIKQTMATEPYKLIASLASTKAIIAELLQEIDRLNGKLDRRCIFNRPLPKSLVGPHRSISSTVSTPTPNPEAPC
jgi:hypothetical protein